MPVPIPCFLTSERNFSLGATYRRQVVLTADMKAEIKKIFHKLGTNLSNCLILQDTKSELTQPSLNVSQLSLLNSPRHSTSHGLSHTLPPQKTSAGEIAKLEAIIDAHKAQMVLQTNMIAALKRKVNNRIPPRMAATMCSFREECTDKPGRRRNSADYYDQSKEQVLKSCKSQPELYKNDDKTNPKPNKGIVNLNEKLQKFMENVSKRLDSTAAQVEKVTKYAQIAKMIQVKLVELVKKTNVQKNKLSSELLATKKAKNEIQMKYVETAQQLKKLQESKEKEMLDYTLLMTKRASSYVDTAKQLNQLKEKYIELTKSVKQLINHQEENKVKLINCIKDISNNKDEELKKLQIELKAVKNKLKEEGEDRALKGKEIHEHVFKLKEIVEGVQYAKAELKELLLKEENIKVGIIKNAFCNLQEQCKKLLTERYATLLQLKNEKEKILARIEEVRKTVTEKAEEMKLRINNVGTCIKTLTAQSANLKDKTKEFLKRRQLEEAQKERYNMKLFQLLAQLKSIKEEFNGLKDSTKELTYTVKDKLTLVTTKIRPALSNPHKENKRVLLQNIKGRFKELVIKFSKMIEAVNKKVELETRSKLLESAQSKIIILSDNMTRKRSELAKAQELIKKMKAEHSRLLEEKKALRESYETQNVVNVNLKPFTKVSKTSLYAGRIKHLLVTLGNIKMEFSAFTRLITSWVDSERAKTKVTAQAFTKTLAGITRLLNKTRAISSCINVEMPLQENPQELIPDSIKATLDKLFVKCYNTMQQVYIKAEDTIMQAERMGKYVKLIRLAKGRYNSCFTVSTMNLTVLFPSRLASYANLVRGIANEMHGVKSYYIDLAEVLNDCITYTTSNIHKTANFCSTQLTESKKAIKDLRNRLRRQDAQYQGQILKLTGEKTHFENIASQYKNALLSLSKSRSKALSVSPCVLSESVFKLEEAKVVSPQKPLEDLKIKLGNTILNLEDTRKEKEYFKTKCQKLERQVKDHHETVKALRNRLEQNRLEEQNRDKVIVELTETYEKITAAVQDLKQYMEKIGIAFPETGDVSDLFRALIEHIENQANY
eukprot:TRINITY_DN88939_c0_g1_i1.p1 TRINITY_DN88939_c0_g1~~TRINITY_DN88939_c0_g1_i1.p1  ORF type:complete len:1061 (+),score=146.05 TRINITY_DN88939_c0_g1_i1:281-3463(+)